MKKYLKILILMLLPLSIFAHELEVEIVDNKDGTFTILGQFNTGESAAGALVILEALNTNKVLKEARLDDNGKLTLKIPLEPYQIVFDDEDEDHKIIKAGVEPIGGFKKQEIKKEKSRTNMQISSSNAVTICIIIAFILLFATIFISIKNTNKLLNELKK
ncbi:hypothetical protein OZZ08_02705 [Malaciobacter mytili]|uniref:hypothetical protein n=1 Tax=Malaciobacter mytili TaxID=603050 RepID=UPI003BAE7C0B